MNTYRYPKSPQQVDPKMIEPSEDFRKEVKAVLQWIVIFIATYVLLVIAAIGLAVLAGLAGYWVVTFSRSLWGILFGIGFVGLGVMVLYFLFKFVFKSTTFDRSKMIEIRAADHPKLFDFLKKLAAETQTPLPKRVYLSPDVNASVFYDSSFWSMFFPVKKNLNIGLGLVNCVNVSELKAVIAHEFGHFSQKSMKLGSYVYNVNHIIHDMLFDNDDYEQTLQAWGNVSNVFMFFAEVTGVIVRVIKEILERLYGSMNERYMALSRQMEFHADAVAASVSGSEPLVKALYRLDVAQTCYMTVLSYYDVWLKDNRKGENLYRDHEVVMKNFAEFHALPIENNQLQVSGHAFAKYRKTRVVIKNQWASHPGNEEREQHLRKLAIQSDDVPDSAWTLFNDPHRLQAQVTNGLYEDVSFQQAPDTVDAETFKTLFLDAVEKSSYHKGYKGFYDGREITVFDVEAAAQRTPPAGDLDEILSERTLNLPFLINGLTSDIEALDRVEVKSNDIKTFDFEGRKYTRSEAREINAKLKAELKEVRDSLAQADVEMFLLFHKRSHQAGRAEEAVKQYKAMFSTLKNTGEDLRLIEEMISEGGQLFQGQVTEGAAMMITNNMRREGEKLKKMITGLLQDDSFAPFYSSAERKVLESYLGDQRKFFDDARLNAEAITLHIEAINLFGRIRSEQCFAQKRELLNTQAEVIQGIFSFA